MSFPNYAGKYQCRPVLTAQDIVNYRRSLGRLADVPDLQGVLLCLERGLPRRLRWQIPIREAGKMNGDLYAVKKTKNRVAVMANFGGGSPTFLRPDEIRRLGEIIRRHYLTTPPDGLRDIGRDLCLSAQRVQQIERIALRALRGLVGAIELSK